MSDAIIMHYMMYERVFDHLTNEIDINSLDFASVLLQLPKFSRQSGSLQGYARDLTSDAASVDFRGLLTFLAAPSCCAFVENSVNSQKLSGYTVSWVPSP